MSQKTVLMLLGICIGISGFYLLFSVDWKIAFGVFLAVWSNNITVRR